MTSSSLPDDSILRELRRRGSRAPNSSSSSFSLPRTSERSDATGTPVLLSHDCSRHRTAGVSELNQAVDVAVILRMKLIFASVSSTASQWKTLSFCVYQSSYDSQCESQMAYGCPTARHCTRRLLTLLVGPTVVQVRRARCRPRFLAGRPSRCQECNTANWQQVTGRCHRRPKLQ